MSFSTDELLRQAMMIKIGEATEDDDHPIGFVTITSEMNVMFAWIGEPLGWAGPALHTVMHHVVNCVMIDKYDHTVHGVCTVHGVGTVPMILS